MIKISKIFRPKGFYSAFLTPLARYVPNTIENIYQEHLFITTCSSQRFSTNSSELDSKIHINMRNKKTYVLHDHLKEVETQPKEMLDNILQRLKDAIEQNGEHFIEFNKEDLQNAGKLVHKIQDSESKEALRFIFHVLETMSTKQIATLEDILKTAQKAHN